MHFAVFFTLSHQNRLRKNSVHSQSTWFNGKTNREREPQECEQDQFEVAPKVGAGLVCRRLVAVARRTLENGTVSCRLNAIAEPKSEFCSLLQFCTFRLLPAGVEVSFEAGKTGGEDLGRRRRRGGARRQRHWGDKHAEMAVALMVYPWHHSLECGAHQQRLLVAAAPVEAFCSCRGIQTRRCHVSTGLFDFYFKVADKSLAHFRTGIPQKI